VSTASPALVTEERRCASVCVARSHLVLLALTFIVTLPLVNPLVHGDGVGYNAYLRAPLIQHNLRFEEDWRHANQGFVESRLGPDNQLHPDQYTATGRIGNLFTVGPAILWTPFFLLAHVTVLAADVLGANVPADGFSFPYRALVAFGTAFYGFCGILLSYLLARKYLESSWALLATLAIWAGSSLPVYMYFNPFWSHAHSAFIVALFLWYWDHTRLSRTWSQWLLLGVISGLLVDVYFVNGAFLLIPLAESIRDYVRSVRSRDTAAILHQFAMNVLYLATFLVMLLPTLITRKIIFGGMLRLGAYSTLGWNWHAPYWRSVLFSSDHGMLSWTPLLAFALLGLFLPFAAVRRIQGYLALAALAFFYVIASYPFWDGLASYGNRFFISLTPVFIFGLATSMQRVSGLFRSFRAAYATQAFAVGLFVLWNLAFIFQWGTHLVPARGEISWSAMVHNQFVEVPGRISRSMETYFTHRGEMMQHIEQEDIQQQKLNENHGE
jgi:hypothetical protein